MHWQSAPVDDNGTRLAYLDSGAPPTSDYTTFVIVHGHTFHAPVFSRLFRLAHKHNARLIALNRRDYAHSTPYSEAELKALESGDEDAHSKFLRERGLEIAKFLYWVVTELKVPRTSSVDGTTSGGLVIMGWSLGNLFSNAFVANLDTYPLAVTQALEPYLKSLIIYASPSLFLGYEDPPDIWNPFFIPENPKRIAPINFGTWVTSYYKHPAFSGAQKSDVLTQASFIQHTPQPQYRPPTTDTISADILTEILDLVPNERSERFFADMSLSLMHGLLEKAVVVANESRFPHLNVCFVYGQEDIWAVVWAAHKLEREIEKWQNNGESLRATKVLSVPDVNHMIHWDHPELFLKLITRGEIPQNDS